MRMARCTAASTLLGIAWLATTALGVTVTDYGAVGDGAADATEAFRAALAADADVLVPPGTYVVGELDVPEGRCLRGVGRSSVLRMAKGAGYLLALKDGTRIFELALDGAGQGEGFESGLVRVAHAKDAEIEGVAISNCGMTAILADHAEGLAISGCHIERVFRAVSLVFSSRVRVCDNVVLDCTEHGIVFWGNWQWEQKLCADLLIEGNYCQDAGGGPIWGAGGVRVVTVGNVVVNATDVGIDYEFCEDGTIAGNMVTGAVNAGISLFYSCRNVAITGNSVVVPDLAEGVRAGVWLTDTNRAENPNDIGHRNITIVGNTIRAEGDQKRGILIGVDAEGVIYDANALSNAIIEDHQVKGP
jgi:hypothetical protein